MTKVFGIMGAGCLAIVPYQLSYCERRAIEIQERGCLCSGEFLGLCYCIYLYHVLNILGDQQGSLRFGKMS